MSLNPVRTLLLALALMLGQCFMLSHAGEHLAGEPQQGCELCGHAERLDSGPAIAAAQVAAGEDGCEATQPPLSLVRQSPKDEGPSIRGPPELFFSQEA